MYELRKSHLAVLSSALINIGSGLFLALFTIKDPSVLTGLLIFAILCFRIAVDIEEVLDNYD